MWMTHDDGTDISCTTHAALHTLIDHIESSPLRPDADPAATVSLLMAQEDPASLHGVDNVVLQWDNGTPVAVQAIGKADTRRRLTTAPALSRLLDTIKGPFADKVLNVEGEAEFAKTVSAFTKARNDTKVRLDTLDMPSPSPRSPRTSSLRGCASRQW